MYVFANVLQPLIDFFEAFLKFFHDSLGLGWGLSIVALTVVIRAALLPLTFRQFRSMQRMAQFTPEIKRLQDKYKNDRERQQEEMMRFYRENKINPLASCLPLVAQLPVFLSLFYMLQADLRRDICPEVNSVDVVDPRPCGSGGDAGFLFIPDLTDKAVGSVLIVLLVLYVGSQLFSTLLMSTTTDRTQRLIFLALPFVFIPFIFGFPAGLLVYWITTNLWTIVQQAIIRRRLGPIRPPDMDTGGLGGILASRGSPKPAATPAAVAAGPSGGGAPEPRARAAGPPPPSPRKKKKRSGRRR